MALTPRVRAVSPMPRTMMPATSRGCFTSAVVDGSTRALITARMAATGMLITKSQRHPRSSSTPPMMGPMRNAMPNTAPMSPSAPPRFSGGKVSPMTALATGKMPPAPRPCTPRPTRSTV